MSNNKEKIVEIIMDKLAIEESKITDDAKFIDDLGADSLDTVEVVMALEDEFELDIPDEEAEKITSVQQAIDFVSARLEA